MPGKPKSGERRVPAERPVVPKDWQRMSGAEKDALLYELATKAGLVR